MNPFAAANFSKPSPVGSEAKRRNQQVVGTHLCFTLIPAHCGQTAGVFTSDSNSADVTLSESRFVWLIEHRDGEEVHLAGRCEAELELDGRRCQVWPREVATSSQNFFPSKGVEALTGSGRLNVLGRVLQVGTTGACSKIIVCEKHLV